MPRPYQTLTRLIQLAFEIATQPLRKPYQIWVCALEMITQPLREPYQTWVCGLEIVTQPQRNSYEIWVCARPGMFEVTDHKLA